MTPQRVTELLICLAAIGFLVWVWAMASTVPH